VVAVGGMSTKFRDSGDGYGASDKVNLNDYENEAVYIRMKKSIWNNELFWIFANYISS